jgi:hypothetical protein
MSALENRATGAADLSAADDLIVAGLPGPGNE